MHGSDRAPPTPSLPPPPSPRRRHPRRDDGAGGSGLENITRVSPRPPNSTGVDLQARRDLTPSFVPLELGTLLRLPCLSAVSSSPLWGCARLGGLLCCVLWPLFVPAAFNLPATLPAVLTTHHRCSVTDIPAVPCPQEVADMAAGLDSDEVARIASAPLAMEGAPHARHHTPTQPSQPTQPSTCKHRDRKSTNQTSPHAQHTQTSTRLSSRGPTSPTRWQPAARTAGRWAPR